VLLDLIGFDGKDTPVELWVNETIGWKEAPDWVLGRHPLNGKLHLAAFSGWFD
jgi:hypothetical protein